LARFVQCCAQTLRQLAARQALSAAAAFPGLRGHFLPRPAGPEEIPVRLCPRRDGLCGQPGRAGRGVLQRRRGAGAHDAGGLHHTIKAFPKTANRASRAQLYEPFYADFGPLNLGHAYKFCRRTAELVQVAITSYISRTPILGSALEYAATAALWHWRARPCAAALSGGAAAGAHRRLRAWGRRCCSIRGPTRSTRRTPQCWCAAPGAMCCSLSGYWEWVPASHRISAL